MKQTLLKQAFNFNTSGNGKCYYGATIDSVVYDGERVWDTRWDLIKNCTNFLGKDVLEIGCNMGILLTYLKKYAHINKAVGVDEPDDMLASSNKHNTIKAAKYLNQAFEIDDIQIMQMDLNTENYESKIGIDFDIVAAMSILKWINDQDRFLRYLSNFNTILYEGHDSDTVEINRFANYGFGYKILGKTQTGASYSPDHTRTLILFEK